MPKKKEGEAKPEVQKRKASLTEGNIRIMDAIMSGDFLQASLSEQKRHELEKKLGVSDAAIYATLRKMQDMGYIVGYIPLVTEDGKRIMDAMKQMFGLSDETSLSDMMQ